ncbi:MAG: class I SAM-dependent methyltransferase [bacterium]|jgi:ubiquinone/menaquinone biosynthesis C-methylase UbiE|nr:class I SAM-dependent methyltransferase [bacterium]
MFDLHYYFHVGLFKLRDLLLPRKNVLKELAIKPELIVLDFGCGPGSYTICLSKMVGEKGRVYAVDIHPLAIKNIDHIAAREKLKNVFTICSDCQTGLLDQSVDIVLLYDVFHILQEPNKVLDEIYRILKPDGILSFQDHCIKDDEIQQKIAKANKFVLIKRNKYTYKFIKGKT